MTFSNIIPSVPSVTRSELNAMQNLTFFDTVCLLPARLQPYSAVILSEFEPQLTLAWYCNVPSVWSSLYVIFLPLRLNQRVQFNYPLNILGPCTLIRFPANPGFSV
ncbi:unnamed protein product [Kuraishia capsulata CBS 1993]|uniref:Uncharacterized protein n=1 Tax=Kuraishia capsulata CBS 1993 TaxID=1382522 RepID=W6MK65_9ASCO|nr:uncharacterized protein KUCA_T00002355001 [Kuraishia capsulata CBS 1993]CDK26383.1 unnamed protein product [Kuraishia capsulata CBS 1993]